ncbi:hypothetical protein RRG08_063057 [Elysia crispata]|uniref:Uncharacterized protein n=1 Tax=Elysia crispata TaxID=231223 RepID=A0AAE0ZI21_9GAST|nr:hypothetical protein RRG08_063057 [Elysia crispata]
MLGLWLCCVSPDIKHQCQGILMKSEALRHHWSSSTSALSKDKVGHREWSFTEVFQGKLLKDGDNDAKDAYLTSRSSGIYLNFSTASIIRNPAETEESIGLMIRGAREVNIKLKYA